jgi:GGDEF domain-containing protein
MSFYTLEKDGIWTVYKDDHTPIGRALTLKDAHDFVAAFNGIVGHDLRDRLLSAVNDAVEECFDG